MLSARSALWPVQILITAPVAIGAAIQYFATPPPRSSAPK